MIERDLDRFAKVEVVLRYEQGETISEGAEGVIIYEVFKDGQRYAAKKRRNPANNRNLNYQARIREYQCYLKEIENMSHCNHINIVQFEEAFRDKIGNLFIVLELCDDSLYHKREEDLGEDNYYEEKIIVGLLRQICEGINYLHGKKLAHRDIDPKNILIKNGVVKLVDFGLSYHHNTKTQKAYSFVGKFFYMAPEVDKVTDETGYSAY